MGDQDFLAQKDRMFDEGRALSFLNQNADKNFVQRILKPSQFPKIDLGGGQFATHKMAWGEADGKFLVFPTIIHDGKKLIELPPDQAWQHALKTGEFIEMPDAPSADWFSQNYKSGWGAAEK